MNKSLLVDSLDIGQLSDEELINRLQELGFPVGPIVDTTRAVYQRKLAQLMRNEDQEQSEDDVEVIEEELSNVYPTANDISSSTPYRFDELKRRPLSRLGDSSMYSSPRVPLKNVSAKVPVSQKSNSSVSLTVKIIAAVGLLIFIFFVYQNMEASGVNPIPPEVDV